MKEFQSYPLIEILQELAQMGGLVAWPLGSEVF